MKLTQLRLYIVTIIYSISYVESVENIGNFLHITDIHYDPKYKENSAANCYNIDSGLGCCREGLLWKKPYRKANKWGDKKCDTPLLLVNSTFNWISKNIKELDFIIYTGDSVGHHDITQDININIETMKTIRELFRKNFPNITTYPNIGNHDTYPIDQTPPLIDNKIRYNYRNDWDSSNIKIEKGGYYRARLPNNMNIISINNLFYDNNNIFTKLYPKFDWHSQWKWLTKTLDDIKTDKGKVWILAHIPPYRSEASNYYSEKLLNISDQYRDIIKYKFQGHVHSDNFNIYKRNGEVITVGTIPSSLMPDNQDPSFRVYKYNRENYDLLDYTQYVGNLTKIIKDDKIYYDRSYVFTEYYNQKKVNREDWIELYNSIKSNSTILNRYYRNINPNRKPLNYCDNNCRLSTLQDILVEI